MKKVLLGMGFCLAVWNAGIVAGWTQATSGSPAIKKPLPSQKKSQLDDSQAAKVRIVDLGVTEAQLLQLKAVGMKTVMPKTVPAGFQLTAIASGKNPRFGPSYLLVYRKGSACFGVEGISGGIGSVPPGDTSYPVKNAVLGRGQLEQWRSRSQQPQLIGQWMGRGPFYRFVGANYAFNGGSELAGCQDISPKDAVLVSEALRFLDLDQNVIEILPPSTAAVRDANSPTSTVVRYPTQSELNQFNRSLSSGAFGPGVTLSPASRSQRRAYQTTWAKVNPTGAKFAGAWVSGDRYYYVYPSKVKSRVCVVTLIDGKYEFSNGQSISRELRYRDSGLFWVDQTEVLAARDSGDGKLYPVYAAQSTPDAGQLANFDYGFQNAECTTELPGP